MASSICRNSASLRSKSAGIGPCRRSISSSVSTKRRSVSQGDLAPDSRLPRPHEADEDEVFSERPYLGDQGIRSTYAR